MKIIFAQGNPGSQYTLTRHNIGFIFADMLAAKYKVDFLPKQKFHADVADITVGGEKTLIVKPTTFYNETGISARALVDFYKIDATQDFLVIHDDLALPFGTLRTREQGRDAGNNGVKSLNAHIGQEHKRIRVGVYHQLRDHMHDADFVLGTFSQDEKNALPILFNEAERFIDAFIHDRFVNTKVVIPLQTDDTSDQ
jgi:PTH1 family peptidyl-tRNA hydrolase